MSGGSDSPGYWPVEPLRDIATAASRKMRWGDVWIPEEKITGCRSLRYAHDHRVLGRLWKKTDKGTLEVGKLADIAVLAQDPFAVQPEKIRRTQSGDDHGWR